MTITPSNPENDRAWAVAQFQEWANQPAPHVPASPRRVAHYRMLAVRAGVPQTALPAETTPDTHPVAICHCGQDLVRASIVGWVHLATGLVGCQQ